MKIAVFTSNQPRHQTLIRRLAEISDEVHAIIECTTVAPGKVDDFFRKSDVMQNYFSRVIAAERKVFGPPRFSPSNVRTLSLRMGDLNHVDLETLKPALGADLFVVFGATYIRGALCERLVERRALNIHMGVSPYYRGSSCNFWALNDGNADLVGATIHLLSKGLDSGPMLFHALPKSPVEDGFELGMRAVDAAQLGLVSAISSGRVLKLEPVFQDKTDEIRYTRNADFTDEVAEKYLDRLKVGVDFVGQFKNRSQRKLLNPYLV